jgi:hypothetical protein
VQPLWKTIWRLLKKLNIDLPCDPAIPILEIYPKECDISYSRGTCTPMFIAALLTIAKAVMLLDLGHTQRGEHIQEEWG